MEKRDKSNSERRHARQLAIRISLGLLFVVLLNVALLYLFDTPRARQIEVANSEMIDGYRLLESQIHASQQRVQQMMQRDKQIYRSLFALDTINTTSWGRPYPETNYTQFDEMPYSQMIQDRWREIDVLAKMLYLQSTSIDQIEPLVASSTERSEAIPAIWPIDRTAMKHGIGAFGRRFHPIYKRYMHHKGVDMACDTGTPVYATGNAVVERSNQGFRRSGYGQALLLKHEYGYHTRYAHLSKRLVNVGDTVKRGDIIGLVGNTGGSTGPHLHYEVIYRGTAVNPISFFNKNMSSEEYAELMAQTYISEMDASDDKELSNE